MMNDLHLELHPTPHADLLGRVSVASPCSARWEDMAGDEKSRRCAQCNLSVHNLSAMTRAEAEAIVARKVGEPGARVCVRFFRRADGTILTRDCPVGLAALRARASATARKVAAGAVMLLTGALALGVQWRGQRPERLAAMQPFAALREWLNPAAPPVTRGVVMMGDMCVAPTIPNVTKGTPTSGAPQGE